MLEFESLLIPSAVAVICVFSIFTVCDEVMYIPLVPSKLELFLTNIVPVPVLPTIALFPVALILIPSTVKLPLLVIALSFLQSIIPVFSVDVSVIVKLALLIIFFVVVNLCPFKFNVIVVSSNTFDFS